MKNIASPEEYKAELIKKLSEEIREFSDDPSLEELADVLEVVEALRKLPAYADVEEVQKKESRGQGCV